MKKTLPWPLLWLQSVCRPVFQSHTVCSTVVLQSIPEHCFKLAALTVNLELILWFCSVKISWNMTHIFSPLSHPLSHCHISSSNKTLKLHESETKLLLFSLSSFSSTNLQMLICLQWTIHYIEHLGSIDSFYDLQILISNKALLFFSGKNYLLCNKPESPEAFLWDALIRLRSPNPLKYMLYFWITKVIRK